MKRILVLLVALASLIVVGGQQGACCANPHAPLATTPLLTSSLICQTGYVTQQACCPTDPAVYGQPGGPINQQQCIQSWYSQQSCNQQPMQNLCQQGCCCSPLYTNPGSLNVVPYVACQNPQQNFFPNIITQSACNQQCGTTSPPIVSVACQNPNSPPQISGFDATPFKGQPFFSLSWTADCQAQAIQYQVFRCEGAGCQNFQLAAAVTGQTFVDDTSSNLKWDTVYRYKVEATYNIQGQQLVAVAYDEASLGNLECWGRTDEGTFCISETYYTQYQPYLNTYNLQPNSALYNDAYFCNANNVLQLERSCDTSQGEVCNVNNGQSRCLSLEPCALGGATNPFGLLVSRSVCEGNRYCVLDYSPTIVDQCYACVSEMECYDYHSQGACLSDNCGVGSCSWETYGDGNLQRGVCKSTTKDNCQYCDLNASSSTIPTQDAYNRVFDACTVERANALSTLTNPCAYTSGIALSCSAISCTDYDVSECSQGPITHDDFNVLQNPSQDTCGLRSCQNIGGGCRKNSESLPGPPQPDCVTAQDPAACELDVITPETELMVPVENGLSDSLLITVRDQEGRALPLVDVTGSATTYFCLYQQGISDCTGGHPYGVATQSSSLEINGLSVYGAGVGGLPVEIMTLQQGQNTLRYYSVDKNNNIEVVREVTVTAGLATPPEVFSVSVEPGVSYGGNFGPLYTASSAPTFIITFVGDMSLLYATLRSQGGTAYTPDGISPQSSASQFSVSFSGIPAGGYDLEFDAVNGQGTTIGGYTVSANINNTPPAVAISQPAQGALYNTSEVPVSISAATDISLTSLRVNSVEVLANLTPLPPSTFSSYSGIISLDDGLQVAEIAVTDILGSSIVQTVTFTVDGAPPEVVMTSPQTGVTSSVPFSVEIATAASGPCNYWFSSIGLQPPAPYGPGIFPVNWPAMSGVNPGIYRVDGLSLTPEQSELLYVGCNDVQWGAVIAELPISYDPSPPVIINAEIYPLYELPLETTFVVETNEPTECRYDFSATTFASMINRLNTTSGRGHSGVVLFNQQASTMVNLACKNEAGLVTNAVVPAIIEIGMSFNVTDMTRPFASGGSHVLHVRTNKRAVCSYGGTSATATSNPMTSFNLARDHSALATSLNPGNNALYVICQTIPPSETASLTATIFRDDSAPEMVFVSDNSSGSNIQISPFLDRIRVKWLAEDPESGIELYEYRLLRSATQQVIVDWTSSTVEDEWVNVTAFANGQPLVLEHETAYRFEVRATNGAGELSQVLASDGVIAQMPAFGFKFLEPSYGVSATYAFPVEIQPNYPTNDCVFHFSPLGTPPPSSLNFGEWMAFNSSGQTYGLDNFVGIPVGATSAFGFVVACMQVNNTVTVVTKPLRVDTSKPVISAVNIDPVYDVPLETYISVETDDLTQCRHGFSSENFSGLPNTFPATGGDFRTVHTTEMQIPSGNSTPVYVACRNQAELDSDVVTQMAVVDLTVPLSVTDASEHFVNTSITELRVETNKRATCSFGSSQGSYPNPLGASDVKIHTQQIAVNSGLNRFYVACIATYNQELATTTVDITLDQTPPVMVYVSDNSTLQNVEFTYRTDELRVRWLGFDNETAVASYEYLLERVNDNGVVINWTESTKEDEWVDVSENGSFLEDGKKYRFKVRPIDNAGQIGQDLASNGVTVDVSLNPDTCSNSVKDIDETDVDCGGACAECSLNQSCIINLDCVSGFCAPNNKCAEASCTDNIENGDETDVDCGGPCSDCDTGDRCEDNDDCESNYCSGAHICEVRDTCSDGRINNGESDLDCGGVCLPCGENEYCNVDQDCVSGLVCSPTTAKCIACPPGGCVGGSGDADGDSIPDDWELLNGLDPNDPSDASSDFDGDTLSNLEEFSFQTDPNLLDTDGDGFDDGVEIDANTDPLDPDSFPGGQPDEGSSLWNWVLLILGCISLIGGGVYFYMNMQEQTPSSFPEPPRRPEQPPKPTFGMPSFPPAQPRQPDQPVKQQPRGVFSRLKGITAGKEDTFERLEELVSRKKGRK